MRTAVVLLAAVAAFVSADGCGQTPIPPNITFSATGFPQFIFGGSDALPYSWPWQVGICENTWFDICATVCGATIIGEKWLLTSAFCFHEDYNPSSYQVKVGNYADEEDNEPGEVMASLKNIFIHPSFAENHWHDDIAIVELSSPLTYTDHIQPVCLSSVETTSTTAVATGYGFQAFGEFPTISYNLRQAVLNIVDGSKCAPPVHDDFDAATKICAGDDQSTIAGGDDGGPLVVKASDGRWYQYGVTSQYGYYEAQPGSFTKVSSYCDFITSTTQIACTAPPA